MNAEEERYEHKLEASEPTAEANPAPAPKAVQPLSPGNARTWAMVAHLSVLLNLVTGFMGVVAALLIYFYHKGRSRYVAYQAMQAFLFQLLFWAGGGVLISVMWGTVGALVEVFVGLLLIPFALILTPVLLLLPLIALGYGVYGAVKCSEGQDFGYWLVKDWARNLV